MVQVSLSTETNYDGELNALVEDLGSALTVSFSLDEPAPSGGLKVYVDSDIEQIVNRLNLPGFGRNPIAENINPSSVGTNFDNSGFFATIDEGSTNASFTIDVFNNSEPDTFLPETFDGLVEAVFELKTQDQVADEDLGDVGNLSEYTIDSNAATSRVLFADEESQLSEQPPEPTPEPNPTPEPTPGTGSGLPLVSLNTGPDYLVEADGTVSAHVFNITGGTIPEGGIVVGVNAPNLSEFDLDAIQIGDGGEIVNVREDGFDIRLTDFTVLVDLPVAADGEAEGLETASFNLEAGDGYEVNESFGSGEFTIADTSEEVPDNFSNLNDIISQASDIGLSSDNPEVTINETIEFDIGNRYQNEDGSFTYVDASEDVDFYKVDLKAGDIVTFDTNAITDGNSSIPETTFDFAGNPLDVMRLFDSEGNELAVNVTGQAPGELFTGGADSYLEYQATEDGTYYLGLSNFPNGTTQRLGSPEAWGGLEYDAFIPASGDGQNSAVDFPTIGDYQLTVALNPDNTVLLTEQQNQSNNTPPEAIDLAQDGEPTVSLNFTAATYADSSDPAVVSGELKQDDVLNGSLIEGFPRQGSLLNLVLTTEGEIPEEGILITVNSNSYLRDYFATRSFETPPFSPGSELVDVVTDDTGRETGFQLRIFEPATYFPLGVRTPFWGELLKPGTDGLEFEPETDGSEEVTFFLEGGEGYGVSETANRVTPTFYDSVEQAGEPSVIPEVSMAISETELIEDQGTETTLNFSLSAPPPEEGVLLYVKGAEGILPQFNVLDADVSGGVYPVGNGDFSGFYFKVTEQEASINLTVFEDPFDEGLQSFSLALQETPLYMIDEDAGEVNFTIADNPDSVLEVSLSSDSVAVESDNTAGELTFNLTANPPASGVEVTVNADNLSEFDASAFTVTGGEITEITDTGFSLNITDATATVELPPLLDNETENVETATFSLAESTDYQIDPDAPVAIVTVVDIPEQVPSPTEEFASNDSISEAVDLNINPFNPTATFTAALQSREPGESERPNFGVTRIVEATEDVDFYSFDLEVGDTIKLDIDSIPFEGVPNYEGIEQRLDSEMRLFDASGNELASVNNGAAPDEEFSRDPYLEFTASEAGTYYVGVSQLGNTDYDPLVEDNLSNGSGWIFPEIGVFFGEYELNVELVSGDVIKEPTIEPVFGSLEANIIEVTGTSQLVFGGDSDDLIDASISSQGNNRIYAGSGDDTVILGMSDRIVGGEGDDKFFTTSGGDNILTGGAGADQFWIATAETPDAANIITDFTTGEDVLGIAGLGIGFDDLIITQQDDNTLIAANGSDLAILQGIAADSLIADNFAFA
ncbi:MAG: pre-peptidase C-terminal domain-containing protein [Cyanobacteria bacterium P01_A01_bin.68]